MKPAGFCFSAYSSSHPSQLQTHLSPSSSHQLRLSKLSLRLWCLALSVQAHTFHCFVLPFLYPLPHLCQELKNLSLELSVIILKKPQLVPILVVSCWVERTKSCHRSPCCNSNISPETLWAPPELCKECPSCAEPCLPVREASGDLGNACEFL